MLVLEPGAEESVGTGSAGTTPKGLGFPDPVGVAGFDPLRTRTGDPNPLPGGGIGWL